jgi:CRISPR-associated endoribonuclease Cas6
LRVRIIFDLKNKGAAVPFHHQYILAQLIKGVLRRGEEEQFFEYPLYNFSGLKGQTTVSKQGLHYYSSKVTLVVSSPNKKFIDYLLKSLFELPQLLIGELQLVPSGVELENMPEFKGEMKFVCLSPLVLLIPKFYDDQGKKFITPFSDVFSDLLYESTIRRLQVTNNYNEQDLERFKRFQFVPDKEYLKKIEESGKKFARIYPMFDHDINYEVRGYTLPFTLYAEPEVQEFIFSCGLGRYTNKGFGMLDLAHGEPGRDAHPYSF